MRVLLLHNHHATLGGAMEVLDYEGQLLCEAGHEVREFALPATHELGISGARAGLKAIWNREAASTVGDIIREFRPDVVHVHTPFPLLSPAVFRTAANLGVPTVGTVHSYRYSCIDSTCFRDGSPCEDCVGSKLKLAGVRHRCYHDSIGASAALTISLGVHRAMGTFNGTVNRFISLTPFSKRLLVRDGLPEEHITVKANCAPDPGVLPPTERTAPYVAFAGRLIEGKGVQTMLEAWRGAPEGLRLRIAGDGPMRHLVESLAAEDPRVDYLGWIDLEDIPQFFGAATAVLVPSLWYEGAVPLVSIRALSVGTPVLTSDHENLSEDIVGDGAGAAFQAGNATSLVEALDSVVAEPEVWAERGRAARSSYLARYTPEVTVRGLERIYREVIAEGAHQGRPLGPASATRRRS